MDFSSFQKTLAQNKVYDAWQYVQSLNETLAYMNMSAELLEKVYAHRIAVLESSAQGIYGLPLKQERQALQKKHSGQLT